MVTKAIKIGLAAVAVAAAAGLGWYGWNASQTSDLGSSADIVSEQAFAFADCKARMFDGSPAIAVGFTQPLDRGQDFAKLVKASEGERSDQAKPLEARWVLGDNPRVLYLPYVTPNRKYYLSLSADLA
jgi:alpha-2-macroglobulin